jgi:pimeloyl-ACP methyl ester carboxylesterase
VTDQLLEDLYQNHLKATAMPSPQRGPRVLHSNMADLPKIRAPTLIIHGRYDRMVPIEQGLMIMNYIADSRLVVFNHCGHWPPYEHPDEYNTQVSSFLLA